MKVVDAFEAELVALCGPAATEDRFIVEDLDGLGDDNVAMLSFCMLQPVDTVRHFAALGAVAA
ncbi:hypothetical protein BX286_7136 [Streptomyces sp. 3211.6]|uniref:hypothetical protein n=1 Tax=Streptomyces TaxID=1883 RepID=UPI000CB18C77|nr:MULTISPECIES: hypothetical protein [Streptomyces]RKS96949.1 hypothetical protein BX286_7136 [Streptomyces sp. 3211.6]RPF25301.1 hypothetical protein EDD96_7150 [Streptomyces sp. Ag109_G2-6]